MLERQHGVFRKTVAGLSIGASLLYSPINGTQRRDTIRNSVSVNSQEIPSIPEYKSPAKDQKAVVIPMVGRDEHSPMTYGDLGKVFKDVKAFYAKSSRGKLDYSFTILPWQNVDLPEDRDNPIIEDIGNKVLSGSNIPDIDKFKTRIYILPPDSKPESGGYAADRSLKGYKAAVIYAGDSGDYVKGIVVHELAHTLGLPHGQILYNNNDGNYTDNAKTVEYGDESPVGAGAGHDFNIAQKIQLGWVKPNEVLTVEKNGLYMLSNLGRADSVRTVGLRIKKPDTDEWYYIEYGTYLDAFGIDTVRGIDTYIWNEEKGSPTRQIFDMSMGTSAYGGSGVDKINGIRIDEVPGSATPNSVLIQVSFRK